MDRQDVENIIIANMPDNNVRYVNPERARAALDAILDWLEFLELGGTVADLDSIYRKISDSYSKDEVDLAISTISLTPGPAGPAGVAGTNGTNGTNGVDGQDGFTPIVGGNGHWWVNGEDTGDIAVGTSPHIDPTTGNWFIGSTDTGVNASGAAAFVTDYNPSIIGARDGVNTIYQATRPFIPSSMRVWKDGLRLTPGGAFDFEINADVRVQFNSPITNDNILIFEYKEA